MKQCCSPRFEIIPNTSLAVFNSIPWSRESKAAEISRDKRQDTQNDAYHIGYYFVYLEWADWLLPNDVEPVMKSLKCLRYKIMGSAVIVLLFAE